MSKLETEQQLSRIYIDKMRKGQMRSKLEDIFGESFLSIEVKMPERIFLIRLSNDADMKKMQKFTEEHRQCKIEVFPRIEFIVFKGKKELVPAR